SLSHTASRLCEKSRCSSSDASSPLSSKGEVCLVARRQEGVSGDDLVPTRDVPTSPRDVLGSGLLTPGKPEPPSMRRSPVSHSTPQRGRARTGSPGSEMVTLQEFLQESSNLSPISVGGREDLLSDYFTKVSEPPAMAEPPAGRRESARTPTPTVYVSPNVKSPHGPGEGRGVGGQTGAVGEAEPPPGHAPGPGSHGAADAHRQEALSPSAQGKGRLSPRERPQSARLPGSDPSCRAVDPRRLSLAPPKDEKPLSLPQHCGSAGALSPGYPGPQTDRSPADRRAAQPKGAPGGGGGGGGGETALVRPLSRQGEEPRGRGPAESAVGGGGETPGAEENGKGHDGALKSSPGAADPNADPQTVWYEYGCV
uniref:Uncharacterized protein n=1 Tax=Callorhinchus milii TaxID=7868 RepID=A0A4W3K692_CALMI